jgi:RNA polymerase sigma factor (sigma-70 family)
VEPSEVNRESRTAAPETDAALVLQARDGDAQSLELLHDRYRDAVSRLIRAETRQPADVDDLVHETFTSAWTRLGGLRDPERFRPWLFQIARRVVIDHARSRLMMEGRAPTLDGDDNPRSP